MYGADINTLSVHVRTGAHDTLLWSKRGTRGDKWLQALVTVNSRTHFQVIMFERSCITDGKILIFTRGFGAKLAARQPVHLSVRQPVNFI